ncbi:hypothetical protein [Nocardia jejuensis]|uniref:hypothetical protein n=1 Tax=Nocardia jejuensis TaxID=328049 RepID=UPI00082F241C|nr:hypothetical protein [Nocardia jejuensis]
MSILTIALIVGLLALLALAIAASIKTALFRHEGEGWTTAFRHGWKGFSAGLGVMLVLSTAFVLFLR